MDSDFYRRCEEVFGGSGRGWRIKAADALGLSKATLYRYFHDDKDVSQKVWEKLDRLANRPVLRSTHDLVKLMASALCALQKMIDGAGRVESFPDILVRFFNLAALQNMYTHSQQWPTDLYNLFSKGEQHLVDWLEDVSWDPDHISVEDPLISYGQLTETCNRIAAGIDGKNPELELAENKGYEELLRICRLHDDDEGQLLYSRFRRFVIAHPVLPDHGILFDEFSDLSLQDLRKLNGLFYEDIPPSSIQNGSVKVCQVSGALLTPINYGYRTKKIYGYETPYRAPQAVEAANTGHFSTVQCGGSPKRLSAAFLRYWCIPGLAEIELERHLQDSGWQTELWLDYDSVDLVAEKAGKRRLAVDVKAYSSPSVLAVSFNRFQERYEKDYACFIVVPDHIPDSTERYEERFLAVRKATGKPFVRIRTISDLMGEIR